MNETLTIDAWQYVCRFLKPSAIITLLSTCQILHLNLKIRVLAILSKHLEINPQFNINQILSQPKYDQLCLLTFYGSHQLEKETISRLLSLKSLRLIGASFRVVAHLADLSIRHLDLSNFSNSNLDLKGMTSLSYLRIAGRSSITQEQLDSLNLEYLTLHGNQHPLNLDHMTKLKELVLYFKTNVQVSQQTINRLPLRRLILKGSHSITTTELLDLSPLTRLTLLKLGNTNKILESSITNLMNLRTLIMDLTVKEPVNIGKLTRLSCLKLIGDMPIIEYNPKCFSRLKILHMTGNTYVEDSHLIGLNLIELSCLNCPWIGDILHLTSLTALTVNDCCSIDQETVNNMTQLKSLTMLSIYNNSVTQYVSHLTQLKILNVGGKCGVNQDGIKGLVSLVHFSADNNTTITDVSFMTNLTKLSIRRNSGVEIQSFCNLPITYLDVSENPSAMCLRNMTSLRHLFACGHSCGISPDSITGLKLTCLLTMNNPLFRKPRLAPIDETPASDDTDGNDNNEN